MPAVFDRSFDLPELLPLSCVNCALLASVWNSETASTTAVALRLAVSLSCVNCALLASVWNSETASTTAVALRKNCISKHDRCLHSSKHDRVCVMDISHVSHCAADTVVAIFHTNREGTPAWQWVDLKVLHTACWLTLRIYVLIWKQIVSYWSSLSLAACTQ